VNIFVSYRRDDSSGHTGRLRDRLVAEFGADRLFKEDNWELRAPLSIRGTQIRT
jgi:hypothetical protein